MFQKEVSPVSTDQTSRPSRKEVNRNAKLHHRLVFWALTGVIAFVFLLNLVLPDRSFSANENRALSQRPSISVQGLSDGSFASDFASYYSDQFVGRDFFMGLRFRSSYLLGQREFSGVYIGKDGYLLSEPTSPNTAAVSRTLNAINQFAAANSGITTSFILVPDASAILPENLPGSAPVRDQAADIASFLTGLDPSIQRLDTVSALRNNKAEQIYYRTDHHWTSRGAYYAFLNASSALGINLSGISYAAHTVSQTFQGTLASRSGDFSHRDTIEVFEPRGTDVIYYVNYPDLAVKSRSLFISKQLDEKDQYTVFFGGNHPLVEIRTTADNGRSLLIFKDSYANSFIQFLTPFYQTIIMVDPRYYYDNISAAIRNYSITDILYLYSADTLFADTSLADVLTA